MDPSTTNSVPECSTGLGLQEGDDKSNTSKEVNVFSLDDTTTALEAPKCFILAKSFSHLNENQASSSQAPKPANKIKTPTVTTQPFRTYLNLPSPISLNFPPPNQPQSLFLQALSKLKESSASLAALHQMRTNVRFNPANVKQLSGPDSLTPYPSTPSINAPPSYSFVLRQMSQQRRPRLMGTFIPSPSFVVHTPPPNYTTAFDIYVDTTPIPPQRTTRVFNFGYTPMPAVCPECGYAGITMVISRVTLCTHLCAMTLCLFCCWICAPLPYVMISCKDVYHYCRNCRAMLGTYSPTDPECNNPSSRC